MINDSNLIKHNVDETVRVWREGGTGRVIVPGPKPGLMAIIEIDQRRAEEIVAWFLDKIIAELREREQRGEVLSETDREALRLWREKVPHEFIWSAPRGGPSVLIALNVYGEPIDNPPEKIILAAHPSEYDVGWQVPKISRAAPGFRRPIRVGDATSQQTIFIGSFRFPPDADLLTAWTRFDHLNIERVMRRLSCEDQRRYLLPYGAEIFSDGSEVLFNRKYQPIYARGPQGVAIRCTNPDERVQRIDQRWFYNDDHSEAQKRRRAEAALELFLAGEPMPSDWRTPDEYTLPEERLAGPREKVSKRRGQNNAQGAESEK